MTPRPAGPTRYVEGKPLTIWKSDPWKYHAIPVEYITDQGVSNSQFRPARCGKRVIPQTFEMGQRRFLKEFIEQEEQTCKLCLKLIAIDKRDHSRST